MIIITSLRKYYPALLTLLIFFTIHSVSHSQTDSVHIHIVKFDSLKIKNTAELSDNSEFIPYDNFIWNDKRNVSEILNEKSGIFVNNKGFGQYNRIYYNNFYDNQIGFYKDGIQLNNNFFGIFEPELVSVAEIDKIELVSNISSFIYGMNSYGKAINIISKDKFEPKPFSQLRYSQDRNGSLFADASFTIPFSRKFNFYIRGNNHSLDGNYTNSDFSVWRGDGRLSWFPSSLWNYKLDFSYSKISRGLNGGLNYSGKNLAAVSTIDSLRDAKITFVNDPTGREVNENYNTSLSIYSKAFGSNSTTMLQFYFINYYRNYGSQLFYPESDTILRNDYYTTTRLGINLKYDKKIALANSGQLDFLFLNNYFFNAYNLDLELTDNVRLNSSSKANFGFASGKIAYNNERFSLSGLIKLERSFVTDSSQNAVSYGSEAKFKLVEDKDFGLSILGGFNRINALNVYPISSMYFLTGLNNYQSGIELKSEKINSYLGYDYSSQSSRVKFKFDVSYGAFNLTSENDFQIKDYENSLPLFSKNDFSYRNKFFKDKLDIKIGVNFKAIMNYRFYADDYLKTIDERFYGGSAVTDNSYYNNFNNKFLADFYIGARIGHANINFTVANIFDSFYYDTFLYPSDDRGGLFNAVSRFTIVWDFIN